MMKKKRNKFFIGFLAASMVLMQLAGHLYLPYGYEAGHYTRVDGIQKWLWPNQQNELREKARILAIAQRYLEKSQEYQYQFQGNYDQGQPCYGKMIYYACQTMVVCIAYDQEANKKNCQIELAEIRHQATKILNGAGIGLGVGRKISDLLYQKLEVYPRWFEPLISQDRGRVEQLIKQCDQDFYPEEWAIFEAHKKVREELIIPNEQLAV